MNYYPFHLGDYAAHTAHLEPMEDLAYRRMLDLYYLRECALPQDAAEVARLIRMRGNVAEVEAVLREFFTNNDGEGWIHIRCEAEIAKFTAMVDGGKKGALKRWQKGGDAPPIATPLATPSTPQCQPEPEPNTSVAKATDGVPPALKSPEEKAKAELWKAAVSVLEAGGCPQAQARSFMGKLVKDYGLEAVRGAIDAAVSAQPADAREYLKATCQRLKGERKDPVTVPFVKSPEQERQEREREEHERKLQDPAEQARIAEIRARARSALKVVA